ncbi:MAG: tetratricopeptide repeat protein [Lachnospiraceae bacterium]|nr:tetratricopeptide repeat protein [Lachnospiraceae bacterium]
MSGYRLCQTKMAQRPYYIENISTNIYSLEELCYYLQHNVYLLDETIINEALCDWIREELGLRQLYMRLYRVLDGGGALIDFLLPIFREIHYLTHDELKELNQKLQRLDHEPEVVRQKLKGDYLIENKKYINGIRVYKNALSRAHEDKLGRQFTGEIYHNMGCAHMRMFQYEEALECFRVACDSLPGENMKTDYLTAYYLTRPYEKYRQEVRRMGGDQKMEQEIVDRVQNVRSSVPRKDGDEKEDYDAFLEKLTREYHNSTGL